MIRYFKSKYFKSKCNPQVFYKLYGDSLFFYSFKYGEWCFINNVEGIYINYIQDKYVNEIAEDECFNFINSIRVLEELIN